MRDFLTIGERWGFLLILHCGLVFTCLALASGALVGAAAAAAHPPMEAIDVLDVLDNSNAPRALDYRGSATRKLGRTDQRDRILTQVGWVRSRLPAGARITWGGLRDQEQLWSSPESNCRRSRALR